MGFTIEIGPANYDCHGQKDGPASEARVCGFRDYYRGLNNYLFRFGGSPE